MIDNNNRSFDPVSFSKKTVQNSTLEDSALAICDGVYTIVHVYTRNDVLKWAKEQVLPFEFLSLINNNTLKKTI